MGLLIKEFSKFAAGVIGTASYLAVISAFDQENIIQEHILGMLGERNELKELYVERFCLCQSCYTPFTLCFIAPDRAFQESRFIYVSWC